MSQTQTKTISGKQMLLIIAIGIAILVGILYYNMPAKRKGTSKKTTSTKMDKSSKPSSQKKK